MGAAMPVAMMAMSAISTQQEIAQKNRAIRSQTDELLRNQEIQQQQNLMVQEDIRNRTAEELTNLQRQALREGSTVATQIAGSGLSGTSMLRQEANIFLQEVMNEGSVISQGEKELQKKGFENIANAVQTQGQINQLQGQRTSGLSAALQIGTAAGAGYLSGKSFV